MNKKPLRLLILEDSVDDTELAVKHLEREGFVIEHSIVSTEDSFREALDTCPDVILADYNLPGFSCPEALLIHQDVAPEIPLILCSGTIGEEKAVECIKLGAVDYVLKDNLARLGPAVKRALNETELRRKKINAEMKLRESEEKYRLIIENSNDSICIVQDGRIIFSNPQFSELIGYPSGNGIEKSFIDYIHPDDRKRIIAEYERFVKGLDDRQKTEAVLISSEGREINIEFSVGVTTHEGSRAGLVYISDITDRKKMEDDLRKSKAQKQALLDGSPDMIILLDTNLKVLWANRTALNMNPECIGQLCYRAFPGIEEPCENCPIIRTIKTGKNETGIVYQEAVEGKRGERYWEDIGVPMKDEDGNVTEVIKIARNITDRMKREKDLSRKNEELEKFNSLAVGRELKMMELKREINSLLKELNREPRFNLPGGSEASQ